MLVELKDVGVEGLSKSNTSAISGRVGCGCLGIVECCGSEQAQQRLMSGASRASNFEPTSERGVFAILHAAVFSECNRTAECIVHCVQTQKAEPKSSSSTHNASLTRPRTTTGHLLSVTNAFVSAVGLVGSSVGSGCVWLLLVSCGCFLFSEQTENTSNKRRSELGVRREEVY